MKSLYDRYRERKAKENARRKIQDGVREMWSDQCRKADISILYTLHTKSKDPYGKQRCREFYLDMIRNHFRMCEDFQCQGDDSHYWVMEKRLKDDGIDIDELRREADELAAELEQRSSEG